MKLKLPIALLLSIFFAAKAHSVPPDTAHGDKLHAEYFRLQTQRQRNAGTAAITTREEWKQQQPILRAQLFDMLGLNPLPEKTDLKPVITGTLEKNTPEGDIVVEKLHFQSRPGLYVTANLYRPKVVKEPLPTILYLCGHSQQKKGNVSLGNKTAYQHHGLWFARNGYVCLILDSLQLGEIEGIHHGTHRFGMWWWINRGYVPAGVEAWNCIRALDYLETRPEVDKTRFGVTGRSGGGAYSWWIAALDERIKCAAPCAGITDLENHVVDGCIEGHCDCMFLHNTEQWDYATVAALVSPRPLMIVNTDSDPIFPLNGVVRIFEEARRIYKLNGAADKIALAIGPGGHKDIQEIQIPAFRWFNKHLQGHERPITIAAEKMFEFEELRVFDKLPEDSINAKIHETFVAKAPEPKVPESKEAWQAQREEWLKQLRERTFRGWPEKDSPLNMKLVFDEQAEGVRLRGWDFTSQEGIELRLYVAQPADPKIIPITIDVHVMDQLGWGVFLATYTIPFGKALHRIEDFEDPEPEPDSKLWPSTQRALSKIAIASAYISPRHMGRPAVKLEPKGETQLRRRYQVLGQTLAGQQIYDMRRGLQALRSIEGLDKSGIMLEGFGAEAAGLALYTALFEPEVHALMLTDLPRTHRDGPILFNVERVLDLPTTVALVAERTHVGMFWTFFDKKEEFDPSEAFAYPLAVQEKLGWDKKQLKVIGPTKP